jgi:hypothetical protein
VSGKMVARPILRSDCLHLARYKGSVCPFFTSHLFLSRFTVMESGGPQVFTALLSFFELSNPAPARPASVFRSCLERITKLVQSFIYSRLSVSGITHCRVSLELLHERQDAQLNFHPSSFEAGFMAAYPVAPTSSEHGVRRCRGGRPRSILHG